VDDTALRADARRNRDRIVAAALDLFLDKGIDVPLDDVARRAGVGIGTLYRRFPDRDALIAATAHEGLSRLAEIARAAWDEEPDAWHALGRFLHGCTELRLGALQSAIEPHLHDTIRADPGLRAPRQVIIDLIDEMTAAAHAEGTLRPDAGPAEVGLMMTLQVYAPPGVPRDQAVRRVVGIMLDGLRAAP
jgi:AcrR family transcriptional regulator